MEHPFERLRAARIAAGYKSASAAARAFGWNEAAYRHHENGTRGYNAEQATTYGTAFSISPMWLLKLGFAEGEAWRLPIGQTYIEAMLPEYRWKPGLEDIVNEFQNSTGYRPVPYLQVTATSVDIKRRDDGYPSLQFFDPGLVGVQPERFDKGYIFLMDAPISRAWIEIEQGDRILIDSGLADVRRAPQLWVIISDGEIVVTYAQKNEDGFISVLPPKRDETMQPLSQDAKIVGRVCWSARQHM